MRLRPVRVDDFAHLFALDQLCFAPGISWSKAELTYFLRYPGNFSLIAEDETSGSPSPIAGFAIAGTERRRGTPLGRLITLDVRPEMRRRRIGETLLSAVEERLRSQSVAKLLLEVAVDNHSAQAFYARSGFTQTGRMRGYYLGRIDALIMEKTL